MEDEKKLPSPLFIDLEIIISRRKEDMEFSSPHNVVKIDINWKYDHRTKMPPPSFKPLSQSFRTDEQGQT